MKPIYVQSFDLIKGIILSPVAKLNQIKAGGIQPNCIYLLFLVMLSLTLFKAVLRPWDKSFNVLGEQMNQIIIFLNNPLVMWAVAYFLYFCTVFLIGKLSGLFQPSDRRGMRQMLFALSSIGLVAHVVFYVLGYMVSKDVLRTIATFAYMWNLVLVFVAVKIGSSISFGKTLLVILVPLAIFAISPFGVWFFMSPYLLFLF